MADYAGPLQTLQAFDGPIPETLNGRLCMLSIPLALWDEWQSGMGMLEQVQAHPERVLGVTLLIALATYVPAFRCAPHRAWSCARCLGASRDWPGAASCCAPARVSTEAGQQHTCAVCHGFKSVQRLQPAGTCG